MRTITLFAAGSHLPAASLNEVQARGLGLTRASAAPGDGPTVKGSDALHYQTPDAGLATATAATVDATSGFDWRERLVLAWTRFGAAAANRWGRASEHAGNDPASSDLRTAVGVTGPGATGAASATVVNGTPPVVAADSCPIPLDVRAGGTLWLYVDPATGQLRVYNDTGVTLHFDLVLLATGKGVDPSAPPPDVVATMTEVLWLTPTVAASRPADPGAVIALHRATDTGAVTLWDGGAWRTIGLVSPLAARGDIWVRDATGDARLALSATRGRALRVGALDPFWGDVAIHGTVVPTAGPDYAGTVWHDDDNHTYYVCTEDADGWGWRLVDVARGGQWGLGTAAVTPVALGSLAIGTNRAVRLRVSLLGIRDDASDGVVLSGEASFRRAGTTTVTELEALSLLLGGATVLTANVASGAVDFELTPPTAAAWTWRLTVRVEELLA